MKSKRLIAIISITTLLISFSACSDSKKTENSTLSNSVEDFREDIKKLKGNSAADESKTAKSDKSFETDKSSESDDDTSDNGIDPEFKATMDSFESFFNDYTEFMEKYDNADYDDLPELMSDYTSYMTKYSETMEKINDIHKDELSAEELAYYIEITGRINAKLFEVS